MTPSVLVTGLSQSTAHIRHQNELREEMLRYREYLAEQAREEERMEQELDRMVTAEVEKQWAKRREAWRREREARRQLMQDVLRTRRSQIEEKRMPAVLHDGGWVHGICQCIDSVKRIIRIAMH